jgi:predicted DNA-binding ribbon-helix-helix protein
MKSHIVKRSIIVAAHKTSVSLEDEFWGALKEIAKARGTTLSDLVTSIDVNAREGNLSSCLRLFVLNFYQDNLKQGEAAEVAKLEPTTMRPAKSA